MTHDSPPVFDAANDDPFDFILVLVSWLNEPHRRRLGTATREQVEAAVSVIKSGAMMKLMALLTEAAMLPIENMEDIDNLRFAHETATDIADRLYAVLQSEGVYY